MCRLGRGEHPHFFSDEASSRCYIRPWFQAVGRFAMKFGVAILVIVALAGCSRESVPRIPTAPASPVADPARPAPPGPPAGSALLWVMVIGAGGGCIDGATIQIVRAEGEGEPIPQRTP